MARAMWKGVLRFRKEAVPVKLYSAVQDRKVHFRLLHAKDEVPLQQRMVNPVTDDPVPYEHVRKGLEIEPEVFVLLEEDEIEAVQPEPSRDIEIVTFVTPERINHQWYDRPYYLGPDDGARAAYEALAAALEEQGKEGVAQWTMRKKAYRGALRASGGHLALITLRAAGEVIDASLLEAPGGRKLEKRELSMANQLIDALAEEFDPADYSDEYRERVLELIHRKAEGKTVELRKYRPKKKAPEELDEVLAASLARLKKEKKGA